MRTRHYCRYGRVTITLQVDITTQVDILNRGAPDDGGYYAYVLVIDYEYPFECFVQQIYIIVSITDALHNLKLYLLLGKRVTIRNFIVMCAFKRKPSWNTNLKRI